MVSYKIDNGTITISGYLKKNGKPVIACQSELYSLSTDVTLGKTSTDATGFYSFVLPVSSVLSGRYMVRFYGSGVVQDIPPAGDWEVFDLVTSEDSALVMDDVSGDTTVTEGVAIVDVNKSEFATAIITINNLSIRSGSLHDVEVHYKLPDIDNDFIFIQNVAFDVVGNIASAQFHFPLRSKSLPHSFIFKLRNNIGTLGKYTDGSDAIVELSGVMFNGVADLQELYEVHELQALNATALENGSLLNMVANLQWEDIRKVSRSNMPKTCKNGFNGTTKNITFDEAQRVEAFEVFMYVNQNAVGPLANYPNGGVPSGGAWYFVGETNVAEMKVRCPANKFVAFWVGMRCANTQSSITKQNLQY